jgi:hypothetical protein
MLCKVSNPSFKTYVCKNASKLDKRLLCPKCVDHVEDKKKVFSPSNILFCPFNSHVPSFPRIEEIADVIEQILPGVDLNNLYVPSRPPSVNSVSAIPMVYNTTARPPSPIDLTEKPFAVLSSTGEIVNLSGKRIVTEVKENNVFMTQILKIGDQEVLTMYDPGASIHLIESRFAASIRMQKMSNSPSSITVVGGGVCKYTARDLQIFHGSGN